MTSNKQLHLRVTNIIGSLRNEDGNANNDVSEKSVISGSLFTFLCGSLGFCFFALDTANRKMIKCFSMKLNKY